MPRKQPFRYVERDPKGLETYYYLRRPGFPRVRLPGPYGGLEFRRAYDEAMIQRAPPVGASRAPAGSMSALVASFYASARFRNLRPSTATVYRNIVEKFRAEHGHRSVVGMQAKHVRAIVEAKEGPSARKRLLKILSLLMKHAVETGMRDDNPARDVEAKIPTSEGFRTWTEDEIAAFRAAHPLKSTPRLVFELALNTGQRRGDLARMGWEHLADGEITIVQGKTGTEVTIPVMPDLRAVLEKFPRDHVVIPLRGKPDTFIATGNGRPFTAASLGNRFRYWVEQAGLPESLSLHGLRKACGRRLAEAACTPHQIMAILGHKSLSEAERYTKAFARKAASRAGTAKAHAMFGQKER